MLELLERHPSLALATSDSEGRLTLATPALHKMLGGLPVDYLTDQHLTSLQHFELMGRTELGFDDMPVARALRGETVMDDILSVKQPNGRVSYLRCNAAPLLGPAGTINGAVLLVQDVSAEWTVLLKHEELRDRLVTTVNHELRTPLTKIIGHSELLCDAAANDELPPHLARSAIVLARASRDLASMSERLTHLAQLDAATRVHPAAVDAVAVLREAVGARVRSGRSNGQRIDVTAPPVLPAVIDAGRVGRAIRELLDNALCHAPPGSTITVGLERIEDDLEISVADTGGGIPAADRERLLRPFERGALPGGSTSSTGLGLAVVSAIAAAHGGGVVLEDNHPCGLIARICLRSSAA